MSKSYMWEAMDPDDLFGSKPSTGRLHRYVDRMGVSLREGQVIEINFDMIDWMAQVSRALQKGFLITIDIGDTASHLYATDREWARFGHFYGQQLIESPLERIGGRT